MQCKHGQYLSYCPININKYYYFIRKIKSKVKRYTKCSYGNTTQSTENFTKIFIMKKVHAPVLGDTAMPGSLYKAANKKLKNMLCRYFIATELP